MEPWLEIVAVYLLSTVKFVFGGVPLALAFGFSFFETVVVTTVGGFTGVLIFVTISHMLIKKYRERKLKKLQIMVPVKRKRVFTKRNRFIVHIIYKFGLFGIAALTPVLFSIPIGCFFATRYFKNRQQVIIYMFASILFWSVTASSIRLLF